MSGTYTTDWQSVSNGDTTTINPQDLINQAGVIDVKNAEIQWRGDSNVYTSTEYGNSYNSVSDRAENTVKDYKEENRDTATTSGTTRRVTEPFTRTNSVSGQFFDSTGSEKADAPNIPRGAEVDEVTVRYYLDENSGAPVQGIDVEFDDDPFWDNYDTTQRNIYLGGRTKKKIFEDSFSVSYDENEYYSQIDSAQINIIDPGTNTGGYYSVSGTFGIVAEVEVKGKKVSYEQEVSREYAEAKFPDVEGVDSHRAEVYVNGDLDRSRTQDYANGDKIGETYRAISPNTENGTVEVRCISYGEVRKVDPASLSVTFPNVPSGWDFRNHDFHRTGYGNSFDITYRNREGETITETVDDPSKGTVTLQLETEYERTVKDVEETVNPRVEGEYLEEGFNTDKVLFVMDKSESVGGTDRKIIAKDILSSFPDSTEAALLSFNFNSSIDVPPATLEENRPLMKQAIDTLPADGGTDIDQAIQFARDNIGDEQEAGTIVLITDGNNFTEAADLAPEEVNFDFLAVGVGDNIDTEFLTNLTSLLGGLYFEGSVNDTELPTRLSENSLSSWVELSGFTTGEQTLTHSIDESNKAEFRIRFDWEFETPEPIYGTTGFYDESAGVWRECAVTDVNSNSLEYNHVTIYNEDVDDWGALDVIESPVDDPPPEAINAFRFYDADAGWLAPREYDTV